MVELITLLFVALMAMALVYLQRYKRLFLTSPARMLVVDFQGRILEANPAARAFYGPRLVGHRVYELTPLSIPEVDAHLRQHEGRFRSLHRCHDGSLQEVEVSTARVRFRTDEALLCVIQDASERVRAEQDMELYKALVDQIGEPIYVTDPETETLVYLNAAGRAYLPNFQNVPLKGLYAAHQPGRPGLLVTDPQGRPVWEESEVHLPDGRVIPVERSFSPIRHGDRVLMAGFIRNISERVERMQKLRAVLDAAPVGILVRDQEGKLVDCNPVAERLLGWSRERMEAGGIPLPDLEMRQRLRQGQGSQTQVVTTDGQDGEPRILCLHLTTLPAGQILEILEDLTERDQALSRLALQARALEAAANAIFITNPEGVIEYVNAAFEQITGYSAGEALGATPRLLKSGAQDEEFYRLLWTTIKHGEIFRGEVVNRRRDGSHYQASMTISPMLDGEGRINRYIGVQEDISERKAAEQKVQHQAFHDVLTGLPNRAFMLSRLERVLKRPQGVDQAALIFLDLDHFKQVNDTLGHACGDQLLLQVAARIQEVVRCCDTLARFGGDEFVLLLVGELHGSYEPALVAERVMERLREPFLLEGGEVFTTASLGIALGPRDGASPEELLKAADLALYRAKERRETYEFFSPEIQEQAVYRHRVGSDLRRALDRNELRLYYQPQVLIRTGELVGMEALVRWQHPERGLLAPGAFIKVAEETGLINQLGAWVIREAAHQIALWSERGFTVPCVAVNTSLSQYLQGDLASLVADVMRHHRLERGQLELEITESMLDQDQSGVLQQMQAMAAMGVRFSLDDFGTGYSSLAYLQRYPVSTLKIPQQFVLPAVGDSRLTALVRTIVKMAQALSLETVGEGVETEAHLRLLEQAGCTIAQGYHFARPQPAEEMVHWMTRSFQAA